jgi:hypothetical protein
VNKGKTIFKLNCLRCDDSLLGFSKFVKYCEILVYLLIFMDHFKDYVVKMKRRQDFVQTNQMSKKTFEKYY